MAGAIGKTKVLVVRSADRVSGVPSNFTVNVGSFNTSPTYCSYHQVSLPNGFYNITSAYNTFSVDLYLTGTLTGTATATFTPGFYTTSTDTNGILNPTNGLIQKLNADSVSNSLGFPIFTGSIDPNTGLFNLAITSTYPNVAMIVKINGSLDYKMGFRGPQLTLPVRTFTGTVTPDFRSPVNVYVRCSLVGGNYLKTSPPSNPSTGTADSVIVVVQNLATFGQTIFQRNGLPDHELFPVTGQVGQINFQLVNEYGRELTIDTGQDWSISLMMYTI